MEHVKFKSFILALNRILLYKNPKMAYFKFAA